MTESQAEALSHIFAGMVTKGDLAELESRLTWRIVAVVGIFATAASLLNLYLD